MNIQKKKSAAKMCDFSGEITNRKKIAHAEKMQVVPKNIKTTYPNSIFFGCATFRRNICVLTQPIPKDTTFTDFR